MKINISLQAGHSDAESRSLYKWLAAERSELTEAGLTLAAPGSDPGLSHEHEMGGGTFDVIQLVINAVPAWGALALAISTWRTAHGSRSSVTLERDGTKITLTDGNLEDARTLLTALQELGRNEERRDAE